MEQINKSSNTPPLLVQAIKNGAKDYNNDLSNQCKDELREELAKEQGYICCYCQRRLKIKKHKNKIISHNTKIEHFKCQSGNNSKLKLDYKNLFLACLGENGFKKDQFTCDTKKGNQKIIYFDLLNFDFNSMIYYTKSGEINSRSNEINDEINNILNLNNQNLRKAREGVYLAIAGLKKKFGNKTNYKSRLKKLKEEWESKNTKGEFKEYKGTGLYFLRKSLSKA